MNGVILSELVANIATVLGVVVSVGGGVFACIKWINSLKVQRAEQLERLFEKFETNEIFKKVSRFEDGLLDCFTDEDKEGVLSLFQTIDYLCYLREASLIESEEFNIFKAHVDSFLANENVKNEFLKRVDKNGENHPYIYLTHYMRCEILCKLNKPSVVTVAATNEEISEADFNEPTMVIKINRLYREEMTNEELYEVTRQWWKIKKERAAKMKYALAVSDSIVRKAFSIDHWETDKEVGEDCDGRIRFVGKPANETIQQRFVGKSVKSLFPKGAANPIRYFDGC